MLAPAPANDKAKAAPQGAKSRESVITRQQSPRVNASNQSMLGVLQRQCACGGGKCDECVQRRAKVGRPAPSTAHAQVQSVVRSSGRPLDGGVRSFMESRFHQSFDHVRVHTGPSAERSAQAVDALAYTVGSNVVFGEGQYQPNSREGKRLLAHELTHVVQQGTGSVRGNSGEARFEAEANSVAARVVDGRAPVPAIGGAPRGAIQRVPAKQVSCSASTPLNLPDGTSIANPVDVITAAEVRGHEFLDPAIATLVATQTKVRGGESPATAVDANTATGLRFIGIDPTIAANWTSPGSAASFTVPILLKRLQGMASIVGGGGVFYTCLGPANGTLGVCAGAICGTATTDAATCGFRTALCAPFWAEGADDQADTIVHESAHTFSGPGGFIADAGRSGNAACYARCAETIAGIPAIASNSCAAVGP
jgi:hypothetical protein